MLTRTNYPVKPHRLTPVPAGHRFGRGILRSIPAHRLPCTLADLDAVARLFAESDRERAEARLAAEEQFEAMMEQAAFEDACLERYTRGYCL